MMRQAWHMRQKISWVILNTQVKQNIRAILPQDNMITEVDNSILTGVDEEQIMGRQRKHYNTQAYDLK